MEINNIPQSQNNNSSAAASIGVQFSQRQENNIKQVTPNKDSADAKFETRQAFDQDRIIEDAIRKNVIKDEMQIFNFRVTRYENNLTFTNVGTGDVTTVEMRKVVGDSAIDAAI